MRRAGLAVAALLGAVGAEAQITNVEAPGNLEVTHQLGCIAFADVKPQFTPADLLPASAQCLREGRIDDAFRLFAVAGVYGRYDARRVADPTARQALPALVSQSFGDIDKALTTQMGEAGNALLKDPQAKAGFCAAIRKLGPPQYHPRYMIQHGMDAVMGSGGGDGLIAEFDSAGTFETILVRYLTCEDG